MEAATHRITTPAPATTSSAARSAPPADERALPQLGLRGIIAVWAAAALPMGLLAWVVAPLVADQFSGPGALVRALIITLTAGLVWQFVLVMTLVRREQGTLRWPVVRDALWLRAPRAPRTGRRGGKLWLLVLPLSVAVAVEGLLEIPGPAARDLFEFLGSDAGEGLLAGSWGWFAIIAALVVFNTVLGEEFLFRGYLLPRMNGRFGRRDWLANGVLFAAITCTCHGSSRPGSWTRSSCRIPQSATAVRSSPSPCTARRASSCSGSCSRWCSKAEQPRPGSRSAGVVMAAMLRTERAAESAARSVDYTSSGGPPAAGELALTRSVARDAGRPGRACESPGCPRLLVSRGARVPRRSGAKSEARGLPPVGAGLTVI